MKPNLSEALAEYIPQGHEPEAKPLQGLLKDSYEEMLKPYESIKLPRFPKFNHLTGGFRANEYTIFCGATGKGKTTFCANVSAELSQMNIPHYVASIETGPRDFVKRVMSAVRGKDWNTGEAVPVEEIKKFHVEHGPLLERDNVWLGLYENRVKAEVMLADLAYFIQHHGIKVAIIDNFNFMTDVVSSMNQVKEEDRVLHNYIMFCKKFPIHLFMVHHPKKTESARVNSEFDVKGSSTAVQEAQNVLLWNEVPQEWIKESGSGPSKGLDIRAGDRELKIAKMRRRGRFVGKSLVFRTDDGVSYREVGIV